MGTRSTPPALSALLGATLALACRASAPAPRGPALVDHHVHVLGPGLVRDWKALGVEFTRPDDFYVSVATWFEPGSGSPVGRAVLVPMAHLYGNAEFRAALGLTLAQEWAGVRAENEHVAREAARSPGRAVALASADPLRPYALEELERMRREFGVAGAKLHLGSAGFDFRDEAHLSALEALMAWVEAHDLWLLLHLDPQRRGTDRSDLEHLLERTLGPHPDLRVVVAHLGGSGGFGPWTRSVLVTLGDWLEREARHGLPRPGVRLDLSAVPMMRASEGVPPSSAEEIALLAPALRRVGLERIVFGSDFPVFDPAEHARFLAETTGLTRDELAGILAAHAD